MAAEWGGVSLALLLDHGLLERRKEIGSISAEATASAVLRNTLEVNPSICQYLDAKCASERKNLHLRLRVVYSIPVLPTCGECEGSLASQMPPSGRRHGLKFGICAKLS